MFKKMRSSGWSATKPLFKGFEESLPTAQLYAVFLTRARALIQEQKRKLLQLTMIKTEVLQQA